MPKRKPNTDNVDTQLDKLLGGRDSAGKFIKRTAQIEKMRDVILKLTKQQEKMQKQMERSTKSALKGLKVENQLLKGKSRLQGQVQRLTNQLNKQRRSVERATRSNKLFAGSFGKLAAGIGGAALAFRAFRQLQDIAGSRRSLAVSGGLGSLANVKSFIGKDIAIVSGAQLVDQFLQQSTTTLSLGRQPVITKGLLKLQEELSGVGTEIANRIILDLSSSFRDPKRLQGFFQAVAGGDDVEETLRRFQSQQNLTPTLRALNALEVSKVPTTGDKLLDAQRELSLLSEKLKAEFENLATTLSADVVPLLAKFAAELKKLLGFLGSLSTKEVAIGVGVGALGTGALAVGGGSLVRGGAKLAGKGIAGAGRLALTSPATAGVAAVAAGATFTAVRSAQTARAEKEALRASQGSQNDRRLFNVSSTNLKLDDELSKLRGKRQQIEALLLTQPTGDIGDKGFFRSVADTLGFTPEIPERDDKRIAKLRQQRNRIQLDIDSLQDRSEIENKVVESRKKEVKAVEDAEKAINNFADKIEKAPTTPSTKIDRDLSLLFKRADLELDSLEQQSETALRRSELEIAKIGPFGILQAGQEASQFLDQLQTQEAVLREILGTLDLSTREGRIQSNQLLLQVRGLEREEKELRRSLITAFLDQSISQAFGAGKFSKILFTADTNVGIGLRKGVFDLPKDVQKQLLGSIDPNAPKVQPRTALEILQGRSPFDIEKLTPKTISNVTMRGQEKIVQELQKANKKQDAMIPQMSGLDHVFDPTKTVSKEPRQSKKSQKRKLVGTNSGESLVNIGNELKKVGQQMMIEDQDVRNQIKEDQIQVGSNRLIGVQAISP